MELWRESSVVFAEPSRDVRCGASVVKQQPGENFVGLAREEAQVDALLGRAGGTPAASGNYQADDDH